MATVSLSSVSHCTYSFSNHDQLLFNEVLKLHTKKDPVATLATLILLSYAKILEICFESLSVGTLSYPDGTHALLWPPDATVKYFSGKHILPSSVYCSCFHSPGWFALHCSFLLVAMASMPTWLEDYKWMRNQKLQTFIETHHAPFTPKYRYWTGLLLIARAILYLVTAANLSDDPQLAHEGISFTVATRHFPF